MRKESLNKIVFLFIIMISMQFISSVPPVTQIANQGEIEITYPQYQYLQKGSGNFTLLIIAINRTDVLKSPEVSCSLDLYNNSGNHLTRNQMSYSDNHYNLTIDSGNFTKGGFIAYTILCNSSDQTGFANGVFEINSFGKDFTTSEGNIIIISILVMLFSSLMLFILGYNIKNRIMKIVILGLSAIILFSTILFSTVIIDKFLFNYLDIINGYTTYLNIIKILLSISVLALIIYAGLVSLKLWRIKKGHYD